MLEDGEYAAWYKTPRGEGTGIIILANGKLTGSDSVLAYSGSYEINGNRFTAVVFTQRHSPGQPSLFGIDNIELDVEGQLNGKTVACWGEPGTRRKCRFTSRLFVLRISRCPRPAPDADWQIRRSHHGSHSRPVP